MIWECVLRISDVLAMELFYRNRRRAIWAAALESKVPHSLSLWLAGVILMLSSACYAESHSWLAPCAITITPDETTLYVACVRTPAVLALPASRGAISKAFPLPGQPTGFAISENGLIYGTCAGYKGFISVIDLTNGTIKTNLPARPGACAPLLNPATHQLFVCNQFDHSLSVFDLSGGQELKRIPVGREPVAAALTPNGRGLVVANLLADGPADAAVTTVSIIDAVSLTLRTNLALPSGGILPRGVAISPDGRWAAVAHQRAQFNVPATQVEMGWMNAAALTLIDLETLSRFATVLLDSPDRGAAGPWAVAWTNDKLLITHAGTHELSVINAPALLTKLSSGEVNEDFSFIDAFRQRIALPGQGPRAMVVRGDQVFIASFFTDTINRVTLSEKPVVTATWQLTPNDPTDLAREGERLFNDASLCRQGWQSCASCHPDGRADGLNWDLLNDGIGNPKNTKSLLLSHQTPPAMSLGIRDTAEHAVRSGLRNILFALRPEAEARAIDAYLKSMQSYPSPHLVAGGLSPAALRGQKVFTMAGCAQCHPAPLFTDKKRHGVGTANTHDRPGGLFDTPTLVEAWRTAPYLHDGSAATIQDVLTTKNPQDQHGRTSQLTAEQLADLAAYVLSL